MRRIEVIQNARTCVLSCLRRSAAPSVLNVINTLLLVIQILLKPAASSVLSDHFKVAHIQEHVLLLYYLIMLNWAVSSVEYQNTLAHTCINLYTVYLFYTGDSRE